MMIQAGGSGLYGAVGAYGGGPAALHRYVNGQVGTPRDYDTMLAASHQQAVRHGLDPDNRATPIWDRIREAGSLTNAAAPSPSPFRSHPLPADPEDALRPAASLNSDGG
ncbi:hypothetical protein LRE75_33415 [Streptomyces sp. 372A]